MTGPQLRKARKALGLTQAQLAEALGVTRVTVFEERKDAVAGMLRDRKTMQFLRDHAKITEAKASRCDGDAFMYSNCMFCSSWIIPWL